MNRIFNYDFLKLEFRDIYEDIEELKKKITHDDIEKNINAVIDDIIYYIYKKNSILYDEKFEWHKRLDMLKEINIIPSEIVDKILLWTKKVKVNYCNATTTEDELSEMKILYEVLVWFVVNYGEENYFLILNNLMESEKEIFKKYLSINKSSEEKNISNIFGNKDEYVGEKEEIIRQLLENGENYYFGRGVKKDTKKAYKYFLDAAKYKDEYAETYLGLFYDKGIAVQKNYEIAYQWYYKAAIKGNAFAQYSLGILYSEGNGVIKDYNKAFIWFQKSAENDYVGAYYQLGRAYYNGLGVDKDEENAFKWHKKAAENNLPASQYALSLMYKNGEGCEENLVSAYYWVERAAENDYEDAYYVVGRSYLEGICVEVNYKKAFHYLSKGYLALDTNCIESLAEMYLKGLNVKKDVYTALELYNRALEFGDRSIYFKVGKVYEDEGLINQAISIYNQGHEEGNLKCTQRLGIMYYNGEGVEKDLEKAIEYMEIAAAKKEPHAMYVLAVAYYRLNKFGDKTSDIAKALLKEAYELGSPYAADYLACIMLNELKEGKDVNKNELVIYIKFGVENELKESIFKYGYIYEKGIGIEQNYEKAYYYYTLAAETKYIKAMIKLGDWYKIGIFLNRNIDLAIKWYEKAAKEDDIEAIEKLIEIYERGIGGRRSDIKAIYYVFKLIDLDAIKGKEKLVYYCFKGIGIEENKEKGYELLEEIKEIDLGTAKYINGYLGEEGLIDIDNDEIIRLYMEGIELGNLECYGQLASYLYNNNLNKNDKYKEAFEIAMEGKSLGINKCKYIFLKDKLNEIENSSIVTIEELIIIKKLSQIINNGFYEAINDLIEWYNNRKPQDKRIYYELKEEAIYYNIVKDE
ncbi:tetratricopeptide repeat protein [uncultured Clostridium sp.]|uniref:tetratricopeptide repeat protein n=1 Tax=uncultured Clostridium sp. TaxID=59620 RepID=UPI0025DD79D4|nr:tetratricopeptide repeat protein [uncultured Clostridium sp.]MDU4883563.1 tetratricopeptide repeat protein [Clostridium celatum]MDU7076742.1 tetratricopeptide repeat protein [Clostridium celatum]